MARAAGRGSNAGGHRKQRALETFRSELADLDAEEIQARLDANRIRSAERRAMAKDRLRVLRSEVTDAAPDANERRDQSRDLPGDGSELVGGDEESDERATVEDTQSREKGAGDGAEHPAAAFAEDAGAEQDATPALPLARRIGRFVGMAAAVGGVVLAGAWLIRR